MSEPTEPSAFAMEMARDYLASIGAEVKPQPLAELFDAAREDVEDDIGARELFNKTVQEACEAIKKADGSPPNRYPSLHERAWYVAAKAEGRAEERAAITSEITDTITAYNMASRLQNQDQVAELSRLRGWIDARDQAEKEHRNG